MALIKKFQGTNVAPMDWLDIDPCDPPNGLINLGDIMSSVGGFQGESYADVCPLPCP